MLFSIRRRVVLLILILLLMPVLFYRLALEFNRQLIEQQVIQQSQTVQTLALILTSRPDLWSREILSRASAHQRSFQHLDLSSAALWIVNNHGETTYVIGHLPLEVETPSYDSPFAEIGRATIRLIHALFPSALPYLIPFDPNPEQSLLKQVLKGGTAQRFRFDEEGQPLSLMSATPLIVNGRQVGAIVLEKRVESLFGPRLRNFYRIIGIATTIMLALMVIVALYALSLSGRIMRLEHDVLLAFDRRRGQLAAFPDVVKPRWLWDEVDHLRHQIHTLLSELRNYEQFLRNLPRTLRHEIHNPLNRLHLSLQRLAQTGQLDPYLGQAQHGVVQLQRILDALSEAGSIEQALTQVEKQPFDARGMLSAYADALKNQYGDQMLVTINLSEKVLICGDGFLLEQALDKLVDNAFDFSEDGRVRLDAFVDDRSRSLVIEVTNRGHLPKGLAPEQLFSGMTSIRPASHGDETPHLGLGLYVVRLIAEFHQGEASARQQGADVIFQLRLPIHEG